LTRVKIPPRRTKEQEPRRRGNCPGARSVAKKIRREVGRIAVEGSEGLWEGNRTTLEKRAIWDQLRVERGNQGAAKFDGKENLKKGNVEKNWGY